MIIVSRPESRYANNHSPRRRRAFIQSKIQNTFTKLAEGRGKFFKRENPTNANRTIAKWRIHLDFQHFNPQTEVELENWFYDSAFKIIANDAATTLKVMQLIAPPQLREVLDSCVPYLEEMEYIEDLCDCIATLQQQCSKVNKNFKCTRENFSCNASKLQFLNLISSTANWRRVIPTCVQEDKGPTYWVDNNRWWLCLHYYLQDL